MGVPFDVNETCGKVTGGFATPGSAGRKAKPTRLKTAEFSTGFYENKYFGFSIRLPAGWCITDRASFVALPLKKRDLII